MQQSQYFAMIFN